MESQTRPIKRLDDLKQTARDITFLGVFIGGTAVAWGINEAIQQVRHLGYHRKGIEHKRVSYQKLHYSEGVVIGNDMFSAYVPSNYERWNVDMFRKGREEPKDYK